MAPQAVHAFLTSEADGADRKAQLGGDFSVRARGSLEEKKLHEAATLRRERGHGFTKELFLLGLLDEFFGDRRSFGIGQIRIGIATNQALLLTLPTEAVMMRDLHEPFGKGLRLAQIRKAMEKFDTSGLKHFRSFMGRKFVFDRNGVDERLVFVDESGPSFFVAPQALFDQTLVGPLDQRVWRVSGEEWGHLLEDLFAGGLLR
jgi:hypothetical protein